MAGRLALRNARHKWNLSVPAWSARASSVTSVVEALAKQLDRAAHRAHATRTSRHGLRQKRGDRLGDGDLERKPTRTGLHRVVQALEGDAARGPPPRDANGCRSCCSRPPRCAAGRRRSDTSPGRRALGRARRHQAPGSGASQAALDHTLPRVKKDERPASTRVIV